LRRKGRGTIDGPEKMLFPLPFLAAHHVEVSTVERDFPPNPESASAARRFVLESAADLAEDASSRVSSLVSELATNAILHAGTPFRVRVTPGERSVRVSVTDGSTMPPVKGDRGSSRPFGHGMVIVDSLADRWGVAVEEGGKTVWFEVDRNPADDRKHV
jgi:anti-sigma regulatory factor (Ser/Thr protein kinase)